MEAVFRSEIFRIFSGDFRPVLAGKHRKLTGIDWKKSGQCRIGILFSCSSDFLCFSAGSVDFLASFLQDPAGSGGRNHRPGDCISIVKILIDNFNINIKDEVSFYFIFLTFVQHFLFFVCRNVILSSAT